MERVKGIEPSSQAWEAHILPLNHTRIRTNDPGSSKPPVTLQLMFAFDLLYQACAPFRAERRRSASQLERLGQNPFFEMGK